MAKKEETMETIRPKAGICKFCGQSKMIDLTEDKWLERIAQTNQDPQEIADCLATEGCNCKEGSDWRADRYVLQQCEENIEAMFREKYPEIADIFQAAKARIWYQTLKKITCSTHESGTAAMYRSGGNIEIKFIQKNETKLTASW